MARGCSCPPDGSFYCPRCQGLLDRAGHNGGSQRLAEAPRLPQDLKQSCATKKASTLIGAATGRQQVPTIDRYRSQTERRYAALLETQKRAGEIDEWYYEPMKLWLAPATTLTIDFMVVTDMIELHEVKGVFIREKGWVKLKLAARLYPCFPMKLCQWKDGQWHYTTMPSC